MPAVTGNGCFTKYCPTLASPVLLKQPLGASLSMRERCYLSKKKLSTLPTSYTSSFMSCKSQLSPILPTPTSKPEATQRHESLLKSLLLNQGMISYDDDDDHLSLRRSKSEELIEKFKKILRKPSGQRSKMKLIDAIQRLGIGHHFEEEISLVLEGVSDNYGSDESLLSTALCFRLLRHNGWPTSSDVFDKFLNKKRELKESLRHDMPGILSLYEASYLATKGEEKLLNAMEFTKSHLRQSLPSMSPHLQTHVAKALDLPRHLRMEKLEARNYIDKYSQESNHIPALLQLAKLEFDELQSLHKQELAEIIRWWKQLGLIDKLGFGRDRPLECFLWTVGIFPNASYSSVRIELTKTICILLVMDDIFDTYGSLDELVLFNDAIKRWELSAMEQLPEYMKICYMALYNTTNEIAYKVLKQHGWCIASHLKRTWIDIFEAFLTEAEWFNSGYTPTLEQYLTNGVTSGGSYMALVHSFFLIGHAVTDETVSMMQPYPEIFSCSGKILRLWDDLGTAKEEKERGDVASSIECYMRENNVESEEEARKHIRKLIGSLWLELNGHVITSSTPNANALPKSITKACFNLARTAQLIYQHGDDDTLFTVDDHIQSLFFRSR